MGSERKNSSYTTFICISLALVSGALFWPLANHKFISYDDFVYITQNPQVQSGLTLHGVVWAFTTTEGANWHPLTWLSHMLDWQLFGPNAGGHHLANLVFHIGNVVLLFLLLKRMTGAVWRSAFVAALFAWHPMHVESVAWASERKDVLSTSFWMLTMLAYAIYVEQKGRKAKKQTSYYLLALLFFALGLMAKPMLVTLPLALLLLDFWPLGRISDVQFRIGGSKTGRKDSGSSLSLSQAVFEKIPFLALSAVSCVVTFWAQKSGGAVGSLTAFPITLRFSNSLISYARYVLKLIWPIDLAIFYPYPKAGWPAWQITAAGLALFAISILALKTVRKTPWLLMGWLWFIGTLVPVIGLVQVGNQSMADRYSYIPFIGLFIAIAWESPALLSKWRQGKMMLTVAGVGILIACGIATSLQLAYWHDDIPLFEHALKVDKDNYVAHYYLGLNRAGRREYEEARSQFSAALEENPNDGVVHNNLANVLAALGRNDDAIAHYASALRINPLHVDADYNLAILLNKLGRTDEAVDYLEKATRIQPGFFEAHLKLGSILLAKGNFAEAASHFSSAEKIDADNSDLQYKLAVSLTLQGRIEPAIGHLRRAIELDPNSFLACNDLAWILATSSKPEIRNGPEAVRLAERACQMTRFQNPMCLGTLDAAYAEAGRFEDAIGTAEKAKDIFSTAGMKPAAEMAEQRLQEYRSGQAHRER